MKEWLEAKHGPFPGWVYLGLGGIVVVYFLMRSRSSSSTPATNTNPLSYTPSDFSFTPPGLGGGGGSSSSPTPTPVGPTPTQPTDYVGQIEAWMQQQLTQQGAAPNVYPQWKAYFESQVNSGQWTPQQLQQLWTQAQTSGPWWALRPQAVAAGPVSTPHPNVTQTPNMAGTLSA